MGEQHIVVTITVDGSVTAETKNIHGGKCLDYIGLLEQLLEAQTTASAYTSDYKRVEDALTSPQEVRSDLHEQP